MSGGICGGNAESEELVVSELSLGVSLGIGSTEQPVDKISSPEVRILCVLKGTDGIGGIHFFIF